MRVETEIQEALLLVFLKSFVAKYHHSQKCIDNYHLLDQMYCQNYLELAVDYRENKSLVRLLTSRTLCSLRILSNRQLSICV